MQNPIVTFETTRGTIKAELYPEIAPNTTLFPSFRRAFMTAPSSTASSLAS